MAKKADITQLVRPKATVPFTMDGEDYELSISVIDVGTIGATLLRFPSLRSLFAGGLDKIDPKSISALGADVVGALIAAVCGRPGDDVAEENAASLPPAVQLRILAKVFETSFPSGIVDFLEALADLAQKAVPEEEAKAAGAS